MALFNFSLPIIPSFTSTKKDDLVDVKLFDGSISQQLLFIPDIKVLTNFAKGDLGIADGILKKMIIKNVADIDSPKILEEFIGLAGAKLSKPIESYFDRSGKTTKPIINPSDITLVGRDGDLGGLKALEKSMMQSIFETQKPYMEIIKLVLENLVKIEDIIARVLAVSGSSMNPKNNPKALGYQQNKEFNNNMAKLDALSKVPTEPKKVTDSNSFPEQITSDPRDRVTGAFVTQSVVYSTGQFDPNVNYTYIYKYVREQNFNLGGTFSPTPLTGDDHLPKNVVFGVFNSKFELLDENLILLSPQDSRSDGSISKNVNWINRSGKYFGKFEQIKEGNDFTYRRVGGAISRYKDGEGPSVEVGPEGNKEVKYIKKGFPKINLGNSLQSYYGDYYLDETKRRAQLKGLSASEIDTISTEITKRLATPDKSGTNGIQTTIEASLENGFLNISNSSNTPGLPGGFESVKFPFKPKKVNYKGKEVWIDPEAKYDLKIIKCDYSDRITYLDIESDNKSFKTTKILRFVRDTLSIKVNDDSVFYYEIDNPQNLPIPKFGFTSEISIDNTIGGNFSGITSQSISGRANIYVFFMPVAYRNGFIFTSPEDGRNFRLTKFNNTWKIEEIYWTISNEERKGDIVSLSVYGGVKKERFLDGTERVRVQFPDRKYYYFTTFDGQFLFTKVLEQSIASLRSQQINQGVTAVINPQSGVATRNTFTIPANAIRVEDSRKKFGNLISNTQVLNNQLAVNKPFSNTPYGSPVNDKRQSIGQIYRFQQTEDDTETYYIVEGILSSGNKQKLPQPRTSNGGSSQGSGSDYSLPDLIGVIPVFIELLIDIFSKLFPSIASLLNAISNPAKLITDIIIAKVGDNNGTEPEKFGIFSKQFFDDFKNLAKEVENFRKSEAAENNAENQEENCKDDTAAKTGGNFFDKTAAAIKSNLKSTNDGINSTIDTLNDGANVVTDKQQEFRRKLQDYVDKSKLSNYVYITPSGTPKFLLDGVSTIKLFGDAPMLAKLPSITFGLETKISNLGLSGLTVPTLQFDFGKIVPKSNDLFSKITGVSSTITGFKKNPGLGPLNKNLFDNLTNKLGNISPKSPFRLIFEYSSPSSDKTLNELSGSTKPERQQTPSSLSNSNFEPKLEIPNEITSKIDEQNFIYQVVDVQYSTGKKIEGVDYKYVYIYQDLQKTILEAQRLDELGETTQSIALLEDAQKKDPNNKILNDLVDDLKKKNNSVVQPIIKFLLAIVSLPLKLIFGIITYILNIFKSLLNPFELPFIIIGFISFKWLSDFFNPTSKNSLFSMLGMKFDIETFFTSFIPGLFAKTKQSFDMSKIIDMPFFAGKLPNYSREEFDLFFNPRNGRPPLSGLKVPPLPKLPSIPNLLLSNILCFIESILNSIIDFIWGLLGLASLIPAPHLKLCRDSNQNQSNKDIADLLNGSFKDPSNAEDNPTYNFIFNIKTSDGRDLRGLDREELDKWLEENKDLVIDFNF